MPTQIIHVHRDAPTKPATGAPCNGCGICCLAETCPAGRILFRRRRGPCPALEWDEQDGRRYRCGLLRSPVAYLPCLPERTEGGVGKLFARWIAAGTGCDSDVEVEVATDSGAG